MSYEDKMIVCEDCGAEFVHSADDQARYAERGFTNEPKRCRTCREKRKAQSSERRPARTGGGGGGGGSRFGGGGGGGGRGGRPQGGGPKELFDAVCSACGTQTKVPFRPVEGRPVYCRDCFRSQRS